MPLTYVLSAGGPSGCSKSALLAELTTTIKVKGVLLAPTAIEEVVRDIPEL